jgi:type IV secretory pathway VirB10-like protein
MNLRAKVLVIGALASLAACSTKESHAAANPKQAAKPAVVPMQPKHDPTPAPTPPVEKPAPPPVTPPVLPPPSDDLTATEKAKELYREAVDAAQSKYDSAREAFATIEKKIQDTGDQAPEAWKQIRTDLKTKLDAAEVKLRDWRGSASEQWESMKGEVSTLLDDLNRAIDDAKKQINP